jgi:hypothetical protein
MCCHQLVQSMAVISSAPAHSGQTSKEEDKIHHILVFRFQGSDTLDRFIWVLSFLARNDLVVVPVDQLQYDDGVVVDRHSWGKVS